MKIAIQGELGSFSHQASLMLAPRAKIVPCRQAEEAFAITAAGKVAAALIPIENSLAGAVTEHYDLLLRYPLTIQQEFYLPIHHQFIALPGVKLAEVRQVYSHPVALAQCRRFLQKLSHITVIPYYDTAGSVRHIKEQHLTDAAAIASTVAADIYHARVLRRNIEDHQQNFTRFFLLKKTQRWPKDANKISVAFALKNKPGMLFKALGVFALRDINLTRIESRPIVGRPWEYYFYVDILHPYDDSVRHALTQLTDFTEELKILGIYRAEKI